MHLPTGVLLHEGRLIVADAWHHRSLIWNTVPQRSDVAPDVVLGQSDAASVEQNRGGDCSATGFFWMKTSRSFLLWASVETADL